jgi:hypothetical protein
MPGEVRRGAVAIRVAERQQQRNFERLGKEIRAKRAKEKANRLIKEEARAAKVQYREELAKGWI